ncbi:MAG: hypothetical protein AAF290_00515 [Pseudomonadota bacterium]
MVIWIALVVFLVPLVYAIDASLRQKRQRLRELERIEQRLAAKDDSAEREDQGRQQDD